MCALFEEHLNHDVQMERKAEQMVEATLTDFGASGSSLMEDAAARMVESALRDMGSKQSGSQFT